MKAESSRKDHIQKRLEERKQRLAKALRENLRKRKEQARLKQNLDGKES